MSIVDEKISHSQGQTSYKVRVKSFIQKMTNWKNGRVIDLKSFSVDGVKLRMKVYPNGFAKSSEGYVSVFIENINDFEISLIYDFSFGSKVIMKEKTVTYGPHAMKGNPRVYCHTENSRRWKRGDEDFEITLTVKRVWKEFIDEDSDSRSPVIQSISTVQDTVTDLKKRMESLEKSLKTLQGSQGGSFRPYPDCPICLENMTHETRIMQCGLGHLLCQKCFDRLDYSSCPTCSKAITGRCHGMENYLKTLFDNNNE